jgi:uncharacterized protein YecT (DUF1311 family)
MFDMRQKRQRVSKSGLSSFGKILLSLLVIAAAGLTVGLYGKESADSELNRVYENIIKGHNGDADYILDLRKSERAWLNFRDARADLEARIVGKTKPNELTQNGVIDRLTVARRNELSHLSVDGLPFDVSSLSGTDEWGTKVETQYNYYRGKVIQQFTNLTGPWILAQKAWLAYRNNTFSFVQNHGSGDKSQLSMLVSDHVAEMHWNDLNNLATQLGLSHYQPDQGDSVTDWRDDLTVLSAKQDLRVEFTDYETPVAIANADNSRQQLADANPGDPSKTDTYSSDIFISPDSRWILQITWRTHGNREPRYSNAFLYEVKQITPLHLQRYPSAGESFGELAKRHFQVPANSYADIYFVDWQPEKLLFDFTVRPDVEPHVGNDGIDWKCEFDLQKSRFSSPAKVPGPSRFIENAE